MNAKSGAIGGPGTTPVRGDVREELSVAIEPSLAEKAKGIAQLRSLNGHALDDLADRYYHEVLSHNEIAGGKLYSPVTILNIDLRLAGSTPATDPQPVSGAKQLAASLKKDVAGACLELTKIWSDGLVHEHEIVPLRRVLEKIRTVLEMRNDRHLDMVGRGAKQEIEAGFGQLAALASAAEEHLARIEHKVEARDLAALEMRLRDPTPVYKTVDLDALGRSGRVLVEPERYAPGDLVVLRSWKDSATLGVVVGQRDGMLEVERVEGGKVKLETLSWEDLIAHNPLKIGDHLEIEGHQIWVRPSKIKGVEAVEIDGIQLRDCPIDEVKARLSAHFAGAPAPVEPSGGTRMVSAPRSCITIGAGEATRGIETLEGTTFARGAAYSNPGPSIRTNDDALVLATLRDPRQNEIIVAGVADQASGAAGQPGQASRRATEALLQAAKAIANGTPPRAALGSTTREAHTDCRRLGLTTLTGGVLTRGAGDRTETDIVHVGDSIAWHFGRTGRLLHKTEEHNAGRELAERENNPNARPALSRQLSRALGSDGSGAPVLDHWTLAKGDFLVFATHGVSQANLPAQEDALQRSAGGAQKPFSLFHSDLTALHIGDLIEQARSPEDATELIRKYAEDRMRSGDGRPNNLTIVVVQAQ